MDFISENLTSIRQDMSESSLKVAQSVTEASEKAAADFERARQEVREAYEADCDLLVAREESARLESAGADRAERRAARERVRAARRSVRKEHREATQYAHRAYLSVKFSRPNSLGFLRVIEVLFILNILFTLVTLIFTSRDIIEYTPRTLLDWANIVFEGVALWFFVKRFRATRPLMMGIATFNIIVGAIICAPTTPIAVLTWVAQSAFDILLLLYFGLSMRVRQTFTQPMDFSRRTFEAGEFTINRRGWPFVRNLIIYFCVFSVAGHWMEMGMCQFIIMGLVEGEYDPTNTLLWRDVLYPFPMEGIAVVIIALFLYPFKEWLCRRIPNRVLPYVISFIANALMCSAIEFCMGLLVNADLQLWDYTNNFGNIMGQVCLQNALAFGAAASIIAWLVYPLMERAIAKVPQDMMNVIFVVIAVFYAILQFLYLVETPNEQWAQYLGDASREAMRMPGAVLR